VTGLQVPHLDVPDVREHPHQEVPVAFERVGFAVPFPQVKVLVDRVAEPSGTCHRAPPGAESY
jgi:hypothetical protein